MQWWSLCCGPHVASWQKCSPIICNSITGTNVPLQHWQVRRCINVKSVQCKSKKKFEVMLTRHAKAYRTFSSQIVLLYLQPFHHNSLLNSALQPKIAKVNKTRYFESSWPFEIIHVDTTEKLVTSNYCDKQHAHAYLQPFSRKTGQQRWNNDFLQMYCSLIVLCAAFLVPRKSILGRPIYTFVLMYLYWFQRNSLLKCISSGKLPQKSIKLPYFIIQDHSTLLHALAANTKPVYEFLILLLLT